MKNSLKTNKKGLFYIVVSSMLIIIMIVIFVAYKEYGYTDRQKVMETRIRTINDFIKNIDSDSQRAIFISGFRALIAIEDYVARTGKYLNNTEELFKYAFFNGTVNGVKVDVLINSSYSEYLARLQIIAGRIGLDIDMNVTNITLYHDSPWAIRVIVTTRINITDRRGAAKWNFPRDYNTSVSLINIRDPVYSVATRGRVPNTIRISNITDYVDDATNDTTELIRYINYSYYTNNTLAPSFLMRLKGNFSSSPYGIESLVNIPELKDQNVNYSNSRSIVDYILFSNITNYTARVCNVDNMPSWFTIDTNHTTKYEVNELSSTPCS
jgi:hypothetical protein